LSATADDGKVEELISLARDEKNGESRIFLLQPLANSRSPEARRGLQQLQADSQLRTGLERLRAKLDG
jgi:hypothetical protein